MANLTASEDYYQRLQRLQGLALTGSYRAWSQMSLADLDGSWPTVGAQLFVLLSAAQVSAAEAAAAYVPAALDEQGLSSNADAEVVPAAFGGFASDGRELSGLLYSAVAASKVAVRNRQPNPLNAGRIALARIVPTQVTDAGRGASSVGMAVRPQVTSYTRMLNPPSCSRCAVLAGRVYKKNTGFQRHPHCDCVHVPTVENLAGDLTTDPQAYFDSLPPKQQDAIFTKAGAQAIRDGADIGQVVNARRGMRTTVIGGRETRITYEGITARGFATRAPGSTVGRRGGIRLMPEAIYQVATSQADALRLLRANGYIR